MKKENCDYCGKEYNDRLNRKGRVFKHGYCSRECRNIHVKVLVEARKSSLTTAYCPKCQNEKPISDFHNTKKRRAAYCKSCQNALARDYYDNNVERIMSKNKLTPRKRKTNQKRTDNAAHRAVRKAVKEGRLIKPKECSDCGKVSRIHAHHYNGYENPLDIEWLCPSCHANRHGRGPKVRSGLRTITA